MGRAQVRVVDGPDVGSSIELPLGGRVVIGRGEDVDLRLNDANVSRRHCALEHRIAGVLVEDLSSAGGTVLNGERVNGSGPVMATDTADLRLGGTRLEILLSVPSESLPKIPEVEIVRHLGSGGSGSVFEGQLASGQRVAVKLLCEDADEITRQRFEREATLRDRLDHPAIARILRLVRVDGRPCLIRELIVGRSLEQRIAEEGALPWTDAFDLGVAVAQALAHAHVHGVVHRDVKPGNVMLDDRGRYPKLIDFDLARRVSSASRESLTRLTASGEGLGSLSYLAPEQLTEAHEVDARADVYGLGMTLYHAVSGQRPFADVHPEDFLSALYETGPRPLATLVTGLPAGARQVLERAYAPSPESRFASARELAMAMSQILSGH